MSRLLNNDDRAVLAAMLLLYVGTLAYGGVFGAFWLGALIGLLLLLAALGVASLSRGGTASMIGLPALGMGLVALMIHVARGHTETHFSVFAFLAVTIVYRHWLPVLSAAATIAVHHLSFNYMQAWAWGPICFTEPGLALVLEHAAFVVAEAAVLLMLALRARQDSLAGKELDHVASVLVDPQGTIDFIAPTQVQGQAAATRQMQQALQQIERSIASVRAGAESIGTAASEIASGNQDLSTRTEQTASSLQVAASSIEQLSASVRQTADSARAAHQLVTEASSIAAQGGAVVGQVVATMREIHESSRRIEDIISIIDGIAFQTNILALNAAVEAARAGEQGRGFAVVAGEVRSLAQRSASAAREIKALIGSSVERVAHGSNLVEQAGSTMHEIVGSVQRVTSVIGEISTATAEQSEGIRQVNSSVAQLDQMTQQNAALVEESAAAADSLREQTLRLSQAVQTFRISGQPG